MKRISINILAPKLRMHLHPMHHHPHVTTSNYITLSTMSKVGTNPKLLAVAKECQALIAFGCLEILLTRGSMTTIQQEEFMYKIFHGSPSDPQIVIQMNQFIDGEGKYACLYETQDESEIGSVKKLRKELTREPTTTYIVARVKNDTDINQNVVTEELLQRKFPNSEARISGRTLKNKADQVLANCKVGISIGKSMFDSNNMLPSGKNGEDYFNHVLSGMYKKLVLEPKCNGLASSEDREKVLSEKRKPDWIFPGYMVFVAFGPLAIDEKFQSNLMKHGTWFVCFHF